MKRSSLLAICFLLAAFQFSTAQSSKKSQVAILTTDFGEMTILLYDKTPKHRDNFIKLVEEGFYDGQGFHRVIKNFMIQGGDPNSKEGGDEKQIGQGGPGYQVEAEFVAEYSHQRGALAAARQSDQVNPKKESSGSQFYIVQNPEACRHLNGSYTIFGQVIQGLNVVDEIAKQPVKGRSNVPNDPIRISMEIKTLSKKKIAQIYGAEMLFSK